MKKPRRNERNKPTRGSFRPFFSISGKKVTAAAEVGHPGCRHHPFCQTCGEQEGTCWSTHHGGHGYAPFHVCDADKGAIVCAALHPEKTPSGGELLPHARFLVRNIRVQWPETRIILRCAETSMSLLGE